MAKTGQTTKEEKLTKQDEIKQEKKTYMASQMLHLGHNHK
jgi:hypothetical protein